MWLIRNKLTHPQNLSPSGADKFYSNKDKVRIGITKTTKVFSTHGTYRYRWSSEIGGIEAWYLPSPPSLSKKDEHGYGHPQTTNGTRQNDH